MKPVPKRKDEAVETPAPKRPPTRGEMLDEALDETFPASDPVALILASKAVPTPAEAQKRAARKQT